MIFIVFFFFFFQAEDGIRDLVRSRGLGDVYKRQRLNSFEINRRWWTWDVLSTMIGMRYVDYQEDYVFLSESCLLYTSDAADERSSVDLGGRRIIKKKKNRTKRGWTSKQRRLKGVQRR